MELPSFVIPAATGGSPDSVNKRRRMAELMLASGMQAEPIRHWSQGANKIAQALIGGIGVNRADKMETEGRKGANAALVKALQGGDQAALMEAINNPWMSQQGSAMLASQWDRANTPYQPDWKTFNQGNDVYRYDQNDPNAKPAIFFDGPDDPKEPRYENVGGRLVQINPDGTVKEAYAPPEKPPEPKAPIVQSFYDEKTGQEYKAQWDGQQWVPIGGQKAGSNGITIGPDGSVQIGGPAKPLTEGQSKDAVYSTRAEGALKVFEPNAMAMTEFSSSYGGKLPIVGNYIKSPEYQQAEQAGREFLAAILRKDSGGAITKEEVSEYGAAFLPAPGDGPEVLAQKKTSRLRAVEALKAGMPPQAILAQERALIKSGGHPGVPQQVPLVEPSIGPQGMQFTPEQIQLAKQRWGVQSDEEAIAMLQANMGGSANPQGKGDAPSADGWVRAPNGARIRQKVQ